MKHGYFLYLLACVVVALSGCATMINGTHQKVTIVSDPPEAMVVIDSQHYGHTPVSIFLPRKEHHLVELRKDGYEPDYAILQRKTSGWFFLSIPTGYWFIDAVSGGMYKLSPDTLKAGLTPAGEGLSTESRWAKIAYHEFLEKQNSGHWNRPILGSNFAFYQRKYSNIGPGPVIPPNATTVVFNESTWRVNLTYPVTSRWAFGVDNMIIWSGSSAVSTETYRLTGVQAQYNFSPNNPNRAFLFLSGYEGNFCPCGELEPQKRTGMLLLGGGYGMNIQLTNNIFLDIGFEYMQYVREGTTRNPYVQYVIGLDFHLPPRRLKPLPQTPAPN